MQDTMTSAVTIERCSPRDPEATALITASHAFLLSKYPPEFSFALSIDDLCVPSIRFWTARIGGAARGCVALADKGDYGELKSMYVDPAARGAGIGALLVSTVIEAARDAGLPMLRLETGDDLYDAHRLYRRSAFVDCGPFGDYTEGPHSIFMERPV
ncbi:GNAT family N-acetyltransferase [Marivivens marinus]|uniref:GNAT family N-acetyltransferase n=1 Tax=Marivivens marinus TaxID=3110173 RepID=UPI003B84A364